MSTVRVVLLEDNPIDSFTLQMMLSEPVSKEHQFQIAGVFETLSPLLLFLESNDIDIIVADIFMNNKATGLQLAEHIKHRNIPILFISNTQDREVFNEIQRRALSRFISKPVNLLTLVASLNNICDEIQRGKKERFTKKQYLYLSGRGGQQEQVLFDDILYSSSEGNYCYIFTTTKKYALKKSLSKLLEDDLQDGFLRIHKKFIINKSVIRSVSQSFIVVNEQISLPIGRSYRKSVIDFAKRY